MRRTGLPAAVLITVAVGLAGCSLFPDSTRPAESTGDGGIQFFPETAPPETTAAPDRAREPTEQDVSVGSGTADLQPCELLTMLDLAALDLPSRATQRDVGPARGCQWQTSGSHTVTVGVIDELGVQEVVSDVPPVPLTVGSHDAVRYLTGGTCAVAIGVTDSSRVDVLGTANGNLTRGCAVADQAARLVEAKLP